MLQPNVTVTPAAEKFIRRMVRFSEHPEGGFRLTVSAGGCSGYNSEFTVVPAAVAGDSELLVNGVKVYLPAESRLMLDGVTVDFADTPTKSGLTFMNPNAAACGCSTSGDAAAAPAQATVSVSSIGRMPTATAGH
ncbi:MAG: iron-sulfur cluster assembly accessory protein [Rhizobacter sp.]|jgi:iron-sulfur cluster assembly protein|nr:iron-sulfur cluster assembly accessory protein [Rhizobacter sp.]MBP6269424.1 iron-sulfur cluster assembly accessory protein [Rhizobacter sp.]HOX69679.1 iron-sulfur cluster assembly accessory protein [Burkholderiaceae bacterium]